MNIGYRLEKMVVVQEFQKLAARTGAAWQKLRAREKLVEKGPMIASSPFLKIRILSPFTIYGSTRIHAASGGATGELRGLPIPNVV